MFYRFDSSKNGYVDAEFLSPKASTDVYRGKSSKRVGVYLLPADSSKGLSYPASDIHKQARELYKINRIRIRHDRDAVTAKLVSKKCVVPLISHPPRDIVQLVGFSTNTSHRCAGMNQTWITL